ncbi:MAG: hypothetical protein ACK5XT_11475 [Gemmatimonas sp.]|uniref:hypothetical protein n=1 Tax=Gemmatimonas sp. TaxID=1962908 RepID=UPI00391F5221
MRGGQLSAFWTADDRYVLRFEGTEGASWYAIAAVDAAAPTAADANDDARRLWGMLLADIIPLGGGRVAFPVGSSGRRVYRVWRAAKGTPGAGRTRILGVRAARSRRLPA